MRLLRVGGEWLVVNDGTGKECGAPKAAGELLPEVIIPLWVKKRFRESQREVNSAGSKAQSQSSACRMLSSRSGETRRKEGL